MSSLAKALSLPTEDLEKLDIEDCKIMLLNALESRGKNHSLIFVDNYETISQPLNALPPTTSPTIDQPNQDIIHINDFLNRVPNNTSILVTSREKRNLDREEIIELGGLDTKEGTKLFIEFTGSKYLLQDPPSEIVSLIDNLVVRLGGHPLSIEILARTYREGSAKEEIKNMFTHLGANVMNSRETQERLKSLKSSFGYSIRQLDQNEQELLHSLILFKSPFPINVASEIFSSSNKRIINLHNRSLLERIDSDEYGPIREQEFWLYTFHPALRNYLIDIKNGISNLETDYGSTFSKFYLTLLRTMYSSIGTKNHLPSFAQFNIIYQGEDNDFDRAIKLEPEKLSRANISTYLGLLVYQSGILSKALSYFTKSIAIHEEVNDRLGMRGDYENMGRVLRDMGRLDDALEYHKKALKIDSESNNRTGIPRDYRNLGIVFGIMGKPEEALEYHKKALEIDEKELTDRVGMARDYRNIGLVLADLNRLEEALEYHKKALEIDEKELTDRAGTAKDYTNIGLVLADLNRLEEALEYHKKALEIDEKELTDRVGMARDYINLGTTNYHLNYFDESLIYYNKALKIHGELDDRVSLAKDYTGLAMVLNRRNEYVKALEYNNRALKIHEELNDKIGMAQDYFNIYVVNADRNSKNEASKSLFKALETLREFEREMNYHHPLIDTVTKHIEQLQGA